MPESPTLFLLCGKMASGKSTLAAKLADEHKAFVLSEDEWLATLFPGEITQLSDYVKFSNRMKPLVEKTVLGVLSRGVSVVMDFPANTRDQRAALLELSSKAGVGHELHYIDRSDSECKAQLLKRAAENPSRAATDTPEMFDAMVQYFEPPVDSEGLTLMVVKRS